MNSPRNPVDAETAEICQSQSVEPSRQQRLCLSVNIQNVSLGVALTEQNGAKFQRSKQVQVEKHRQFLRHRHFGTFDYANSLIY